MKNGTHKTIDGNEAVSCIAYALNEVIAYSITPFPIAEWADVWVSDNKPNIWGAVPLVVPVQSQEGVAGVVHGALQTGSLTTTFTVSQGLLLMLPNMYKIASDLMPIVFHVAARGANAYALRSPSTQTLSRFGDHSDVMAVRTSGFAILCSASVQEAHDFALIATRATLEAWVPFLHFFDGFCTAHELQKVELLTADHLRSLIPDQLVFAHRSRSLTVRQTKGLETVNSSYLSCSEIVQKVMDEFAASTGRQYQLFEYHGNPLAQKVIVLMGSGCEAVHETVNCLNHRGEKVGVLKVRLYRPFDMKRFVEALPETTKAIAVLDLTKEPGSAGEPLYLDVINALHECWGAEEKELSAWIVPSTPPKVVSGRYGLSSKEFTPAMIKAVFDNLAVAKPKNHFTIGIDIDNDVSHTSLKYDPEFSIEPDNVVRAIFYGLVSDESVGANKNLIKIIGEETDNYTQGYFVYNSQKSDSVAVSHLRFGPQPIRSTYLVSKANFVACNQWELLEFPLLNNLIPGGTFLLNSPYSSDEVWHQLSPAVQEQIIQKRLKLYAINANKVAQASGMDGQIHTIMQVCFLTLSGVLPRSKAIAQMKRFIRKLYSNQGDEVVQMNIDAINAMLEDLNEVRHGEHQSGDLLGKMVAFEGHTLPVNALPVDGTHPSSTLKWEKRKVVREIPVWDASVCVQCSKCVMVCPHSAIRSKVYDKQQLENAPAAFKYTDAQDSDWQGLKFTLQVAAEDCTGCSVCVEACPIQNKAQDGLKAIYLEPQLLLHEEQENWNFFLNLPNPDRRHLKLTKISQQQMQEPLFDFSEACGGCGETPYIKLVSQLFGDRLVLANAPSCSFMSGSNAEERGLTLFADNAEFGLGCRISIDKQAEFAAQLLKQLSTEVGEKLATSILDAQQQDEAQIWEQRDRIIQLQRRLYELLYHKLDSNSKSSSVAMHSALQNLKSTADYLVKKSVWIIGSDGWAYDIGYSGLDHVVASGRNVNILILDTERNLATAEKDLGLMAMAYGNVYVASVAMGARDEHTLKAFLEAEAFNGPSLILAYSHCTAHNSNMSVGIQQQKAAVESGRWSLYRYNPNLAEQGKNPLQLDSRSPKLSLGENMLLQSSGIQKNPFPQKTGS